MHKLTTQLLIVTYSNTNQGYLKEEYPLCYNFFSGGSYAGYCRG